MNKSVFFFHALLLMVSQSVCGQQLEGKFLITTTEDHRNVVIVEHGKRKILSLPASPHKWLQHLHLLHQSAGFLANEYSTDQPSSSVKKIVAVDSTGLVLPYCEINLNTKEQFHNFFVSHDDSMILILSTQWNTGHGYTSKLWTHNLKSADVSYETLPEGSYYTYENPWSPHNDMFVCVAQLHESIKVYVMDVASKKSTFIAEGAHASWSPTSNQIAFNNGRKLTLFDLDQKQAKELCKFRRTEVVKHIHWSPKGNKVLVGYYRLPFGIDMFSSYHEKLIDVNNSSVQTLEQNHLEHDEFSWR